LYHFAGCYNDCDYAHEEQAMQLFYEDYLKNLNELHRDIENALDGLTPAALDWAPQPGMNSIGVMVFHLTGAERFLIGDVIAGNTSHRDRDAEFKVQGMDMSELIGRLADNRDYISGVLAGLTLADLESRRLFRNQREVTVGWVLGHALKHTATHMGQIQLTRELLDRTKH
jgi:uncharacterized damage-inducible protein DinB